MGFTKLSPHLLILILSLSSQTLGENIKPACCYGNAPPSPLIPKPPGILPPIIGKPPVIPVIPKPPVILPPIIGVTPTLPPVITPVLPYPPATKPACPPPPVVKPPCPPTPTPPTPAPVTTCPADTLKLGACLEILGAIVHIGDPAVECCPLITGLTSLQAAACLCTTIKVNALGLKMFIPIAFELLIICGKTPPPGYNCA